jgi:hypothetical protein
MLQGNIKNLVADVQSIPGITLPAHVLSAQTASRTRGTPQPSAAAASCARYARPASITSSGPKAHI